MTAVLIPVQCQTGNLHSTNATLTSEIACIMCVNKRDQTTSRENYAKLTPIPSIRQSTRWDKGHGTQLSRATATATDHLPLYISL